MSILKGNRAVAVLLMCMLLATAALSGAVSAVEGSDCDPATDMYCTTQASNPCADTPDDPFCGGTDPCAADPSMCWTPTGLEISSYCSEFTCWFSTWGAWDWHIATYDWSFGDGETSALDYPEHTYGGNGTYTVTVDYAGTDAGGAPVEGTAWTNVTVPFEEPPYEHPEYRFGGTVWGNITDIHGNPVPGVGVSLMQPYEWDANATYEHDPNASYEYGPHASYEYNPLMTSGYGETDENGTFVVTGLDNGTYDLWLYTWETPYMDYSEDDYIVISGVSSETVTNFQGPDVVLKTGSFLSGFVWDATVEPAVPAQGVSISMWEMHIPDFCNSRELTQEEAVALGPRYETFAVTARLGIVECPEHPPMHNASADASGGTSDDMSKDFEEFDSFGYGWDESDDAGAFNVSRLPPGNYSIWIDGGDNLPAWYLPFDVFVIVPAEGTIDAMIELGGGKKITGQVVGGDGQGVEWAWASLWPSDDATWETCGAMCGGWDDTNETGHFALWDIPAGNWTLTVYPPYGGHYDYESGEWVDGVEYAPIVEEISYNGENLDLGVAVFAKARALTGRITDSAGNGLQAELSLWSEKGYAGGWATTKSNGSYSMSGIVPGNYSGWIWRGDGSSWSHSDSRYIENVVIGEDMVWNYQFRDLATISGTASANGAPIAGVSISVWCDDCEGWGWAETKADGSYKITGLPTGTYSMWADVGGSYLSFLREADVIATEGQTTTVNIAFESGATLTGRVCSTNPCNPTSGVPNVDVYVWGAKGGGWAMTDATGAYSIVGVGAGKYEAWISPPCTATACSFGSATQTFDIAGATPTKDFFLAAPVDAFGTITLAGAACNGCGVSIWGDNGGGWADADTTGAYRARGLATGTYTFEVYSKTGELLYTGSHAVADGVAVNIDIGSVTKQKVSGTVMSNGKAAADSFVYALDGSKVVGKALADKDGKFEMNLEDGKTYTLLASLGSKTATTTVTLSGAPVANVTLTLG